VAWQASHGRRADGWWFAVEVPGRPREEHGPFTSEAGMLAAKVARMQELEAPPSERPAEPGSCVPAAARPSSSTSAACSGRPATAASPTAATRPGRARSAAAPATRKAAARTTGSASTSTDHRDPMEDLMNLRLHGTPAECEAAAARLRRTPGMTIQDESRPYPDRSGELVRIYLTVDLDPTSSGQPGQPATGGKGGSGERLL